MLRGIGRGGNRPGTPACLGALTAALLLAGCNGVVSARPWFGDADSIGAPRLREGVWRVVPQPGRPCPVDEGRPLETWPDCAIGSTNPRSRPSAASRPMMGASFRAGGSPGPGMCPSSRPVRRSVPRVNRGHGVRMPAVKRSSAADTAGSAPGSTATTEPGGPRACTPRIPGISPYRPPGRGPSPSLSVVCSDIHRQQHPMTALGRYVRILNQYPAAHLHHRSASNPPSPP